MAAPTCTHLHPPCTHFAIPLATCTHHHPLIGVWGGGGGGGWCSTCTPPKAFVRSTVDATLDYMWPLLVCNKSMNVVLLRRTKIKTHQTYGAKAHLFS